MKRAAAITLLPAIILVTLSTFVFIAGAACPNVPTMKMLDVCAKTGIPEWTGICWEMFKSAPKTVEVTVYVLTAVRHAIPRYDGTFNAIKQLLKAGGKLSGDEREALSYCKNKYVEGRRFAASLVHQLSGCDFTHARMESPFTHCHIRLAKLSQSQRKRLSSVLNKVLDGYTLEQIILELADLIVKWSKKA